jgi:hypothetical protein
VRSGLDKQDSCVSVFSESSCYDTACCTSSAEVFSIKSSTSRKTTYQTMKSYSSCSLIRPGDILKRLITIPENEKEPANFEETASTRPSAGNKNIYLSCTREVRQARRMMELFHTPLPIEQQSRSFTLSLSWCSANARPAHTIWNHWGKFPLTPPANPRESYFGAPHLWPNLTIVVDRAGRNYSPLALSESATFIGVAGINQFLQASKSERAITPCQTICRTGLHYRILTGETTLRDLQTADCPVYTRPSDPQRTRLALH